MRTLIVGSGPIGTYLACKLSLSGMNVTLHGKGKQFEKMASRKTVKIVSNNLDEDGQIVPIDCATTAPSPNDWDFLILAVKAQDLAKASEQFSAHANNAITILPQNGLPWWQFLSTDAPSIRLNTVDPGCRIEQALKIDNIVGCVVTKGLQFNDDNSLLEAQVRSDQISLGDVVAGSNVASKAADLLMRAGLPVKISEDIRTDKWRKLIINIAFNPLGALSHLGFGEVLDLSEGEKLAKALMHEAIAVARSCGLNSDIDVPAALDRARASRNHRTSMLQDVEAGRHMEIEPILGVILEIGRIRQIETPTISTIYSCMKLLDHSVSKGSILQMG